MKALIFGLALSLIVPSLAAALTQEETTAEFLRARESSTLADHDYLVAIGRLNIAPLPGAATDRRQERDRLRHSAQPFVGRPTR